MKTKNTIQPETTVTTQTALPTTFQLAQLAAALPSNGKSAGFDSTCDTALELWGAAERVLHNKAEAEAQLRHLLNFGMFEHTEEEFQQYFKDYKGRDLAAKLKAHRYATEDVKRKLFRDKSESRQSVSILFLALPGRAADPAFTANKEAATAAHDKRMAAFAAATAELAPEPTVENYQLLAESPPARVAYPWWITAPQNATERAAQDATERALAATGNPPSGIDLTRPEIDGVTCRWLVSIRQAQIKGKMTRPHAKR